MSFLALLVSVASTSQKDERSLGRFQIWSQDVDLVVFKSELDEVGALSDALDG